MRADAMFIRRCAAASVLSVVSSMIIPFSDGLPGPGGIARVFISVTELAGPSTSKSSLKLKKCW